MGSSSSIDLARHLEGMGVHIIRDGFASWVREDLGFAASDEYVDSALLRVQNAVAHGARSVHDLTVTIAADMPAETHIDAFGGSAWAMDW